MTCKSRIPYKYIMDILCRSSKNTKMNLSRYYDTSSTEKRQHRQLITTLKSSLNKLKEVDLQTNGFLRVNPNKWIHIMRESEPTSSKDAIFLSITNVKNQMIILSNVDHQICMPKRSEFPTAAKPTITFYKLQVIPGKCTSLPNIILLLDWTSKRYIPSNNYCFMTSHVGFPEYVVNHKNVTDDKGKMKNNHCTALHLLQKLIKHVQIHSPLSTVWVRGCQARHHNIIHIEKSCNSDGQRQAENF